MPEFEKTKVRYLHYEDLHYIPEEQKDEVWAAQNLIFVQRFARPLVDPKIVKARRMSDAGKVDEMPYRQLFDPIDEKSRDGGTAELVAADWKSNPIYIHINNIVDTNLKKIHRNIFAKSTDELAMQKQQAENHRILGRKQYLNFLNTYIKELGLPPIDEKTDPFKWADQIKSALKGNKKNMAKPDTLVDAIKASIEDNEDLALYNEFVHKGDWEIALELIIDRFFDRIQYDVIADKIAADVRNFNATCLTWFTSATTGMPEVEYVEPHRMRTGSFSMNDGRDCPYWLYEKDVTWADFVRMFGRNLSEDDLRKIFELNKSKFAGHNIEFDRSSATDRAGARIRIGRCAIETQNCDVYAEGKAHGNLSFKKKTFDYIPSSSTPKKYRMERVEKHYNVWYSFYYVPILDSITQPGSTFSFADFNEQSKFIFELGKVQDQQRFGDDDRLGKSPLIVYKSKKMAFGEILDRFMPKINHLWHKYQNYIAQDQQGVIYAEEMLQSMMEVTDEAVKNGHDSKMSMLRYLKQTGNGIAKFLDGEGRHYKPYEIYTSGHMDAATKTLVNMQALYDWMVRALIQSELREGVDPKPRQSLGGLRISLEGSNNSTYFMEEGYMSIVMGLADRFKRFTEQVVQEGETERFKYIRDVIGLANGLALQAIKDIPYHRMGLGLQNLNTDLQKQKLEGLAEGLVKAGLLDIEVLYLIIKTDNWKYAAVLMIMKYKQKQRKLEEQKALEFQRSMQLRGQEVEVANMIAQGKGQVSAMLIDTEKQWDLKIGTMLAQLRAETMSMIKEQTKNNRIEQDNNRANQEKQSDAA